MEGFDVIEDHEFGGIFGGRDRVEAFGFKRGDEAFRQSIVVRVAAAAHAGGDGRKDPERP